MDIPSIKEKLLDKNTDNITILTHKSPDGDTLGCGFALCYALRSIGKKVNVINADPLPKRYKEFLYQDYEDEKFEEKFVIAVDVADVCLLGDNLSKYKENEMIDICIDHHRTNKGYAKETYVDADAAAACEIMYEIIKFMDIKITMEIATCLYLGIATDTGCFKFDNVTSKTMRIAGDLLDFGIDNGYINRIIFDVKSKDVIKVRSEIVNSVQFFVGGRCAIQYIPLKLLKDNNVDSSELEDVASLPLCIEGVDLGITLKEKEDGIFRVSVRSNENADACKFCEGIGGGHIRASGAQIKGTYEEAMAELIKRAEENL